MTEMGHKLFIVCHPELVSGSAFIPIDL